jgi:pyruvate,orthophosphate dikinase
MNCQILLKTEVDNAVKKLEKYSDLSFSGNSNPLLLSVRSGGRISMPGMMDSILNIGLNDG